MSGLMPGVTRRNILRMASSSNTTLELLCSTPDNRGATSSGSVTSGSLLKRTAASAGPTVADESISDSRYCPAAGSYRAS